MSTALQTAERAKGHIDAEPRNAPGCSGTPGIVDLQHELTCMRRCPGGPRQTVSHRVSHSREANTGTRRVPLEGQAELLWAEGQVNEALVQSGHCSACLQPSTITSCGLVSR